MKKMLFYILDNEGNPKATSNSIEWGKWFQDAENRIVCKDETPNGCVSTVFLGIDHGFGNEEEPPILWETMVFGGAYDGLQIRHTTKAGAIAAHYSTVNMVAGAPTQIQVKARKLEDYHA